VTRRVTKLSERPPRTRADDLGPQASVSLTPGSAPALASKREPPQVSTFAPRGMGGSGATPVRVRAERRDIRRCPFAAGSLCFRQRMRLVGQLSNPLSRWTLKILGPFPRAAREQVWARGPKERRLGNGAVQRAAARVLAGGEPLKLADIRAAIERMFDRPVSYASVEWCMRTGVRGSPPWAERTKPGWYRLARD
jgi:hypothetical protein